MSKDYINFLEKSNTQLHQENTKLREFIATKHLHWKAYPIENNDQQTVYASTAEQAKEVRLGDSLWKLVDMEVEKWRP